MDEKSAATDQRQEELEKQEISQLKAEIKKLEAQIRKVQIPRGASMTKRQRAAKARIRARDRSHLKSRFSTRRSFTGRSGGDRPCQGGLCNGK
jgi:uncharacterized protein with von Willebrand factor type A (vWA) domain